MTLELTATTFYKYNGMYYVINGDRLAQFDRDTFIEFPKGNELYGDYMRRLKKLVPAPMSEGENVLGELTARIKNFKD